MKMIEREVFENMDELREREAEREKRLQTEEEELRVGRVERPRRVGL